MLEGEVKALQLLVDTYRENSPLGKELSMAVAGEYLTQKEADLYIYYMTACQYGKTAMMEMGLPLDGMIIHSVVMGLMEVTQDRTEKEMNADLSDIVDKLLEMRKRTGEA